MSSISGDLSPKDVVDAKFETKRRGYDQDAVDAHLAAASATVEQLQSQRASLEAKVASMTTELQVAKNEAANAAINPITLSNDELAERVGEDAARVLADARVEAAERLAKAETQAEGILAKAELIYAARSVTADEQAGRIRAQAEVDAGDRAEEARAAAALIISNAEADVEAARSEVMSDREAAAVEANQIIREAEVARRQILEDLARRRSAARRQIEQLRAGRERLVASHETVRRALDEISDELAISMSEARAAANTAGHAISDTTIEELEAEIETARLSGLLDTGQAPVVRSAALPNSSSANLKSPRKPASQPVVETTATEVDAKPAKPATSASKPAKPATSASKPAKTAEPKAQKSPASAEPDTGDTADTADTADAVDSASPDDASLDNVVQLDRSRADVDTKTHPAKGRDAGASRANSAASATNASETKDVDKDSSNDDSSNDNDASSNAAVVGLSVAPDPDTDDDDSVGDLFASLREPKSEPKKAKKKPAAKAKKSSATKRLKAKEAAPAATPSAGKSRGSRAPEVDSAEMARRLKRVLADEQSRLMSTLKPMDDMPELDEVLGSQADHREKYWNCVQETSKSPVTEGSSASDAIDSLVDNIRRRAGGAMSEANGDTNAAVVTLRNIYREIKTQQINEIAETVCRSAMAKS